MRRIISIIAITGILSQVLALPQSSFDATTLEQRGHEGHEIQSHDNAFGTFLERSLADHQPNLERRLGLGLLVKSIVKLTQLGISSKKHRRSLDDALEKRTLPEVPPQALQTRQLLLFEKAGELAFKGFKHVGSLIAQHEAAKKHRRRSLDDVLEERALPGDSRQALERRQLALLHKAKQFIIDGILNVAASKATKPSNEKKTRSLDDMLEERELLLELRDQLSDAHYRASSYLTKKSNDDGLERRSLPTAADKVMGRLVKERRGVDYLLEINARHLVQRGVNIVINDLD